MTTYYISNNGSDSNDGLTEDTPFETLSKIGVMRLANAIKPGDSFLLKSGDTFYGVVPEVDLNWTTLPTSQPKVTISSYGSGRRPLVSLLTTLLPGGWVEHTDNIWKFELSSSDNLDGYINTSDMVKFANVGFLEVDGVIHGAIKFDVESLSSQWDFYSDHADWLYVYSTVNPGQITNKIQAAPRFSFLAQASRMRVLGLEFYGAGFCFLEYGSSQGCEIVGNWIHGIGGCTGTGEHREVRYGNGVQFWADGKDATIEFNVIWDIYDVALTLQGREVTSGFEDISFKNNILFSCTQFLELWAVGADGITDAGMDVDGGFKNVDFERNICMNPGSGWSKDVRPLVPDTKKTPLLFYRNTAHVNDISIKDNVFYGTANCLLYQYNSSIDDLYDLPPDGLLLENNFIFTDSSDTIVNFSALTFEDFDSFASTWDFIGDGNNVRIKKEVKELVVT